MRDGAAIQDVAAIYDRYHSDIYGFMLTRVDSTETAEDLAADVFVRVMQAKSYTEMGTLDDWLFRIARNLLKDHYRHAAVVTKYCPSSPNNATIDAGSDRQSDLIWVRQSIAKLPERWQDIVWDQYELELTSEETGDRRGCSANRIRRLRMKTTERLRQIMGVS